MKPYLGIKNGDVKDWNTQQGVNFAVAGATALDGVFFEEKGFDVEEAAYYSLRVQLDWFKEFLDRYAEEAMLFGKIIENCVTFIFESVSERLSILSIFSGER